jgi:transcriptional regulator with XRE-family HTH domain
MPDRDAKSGRVLNLSATVAAMSADAGHGSGTEATGRAREITVNQAVAWNLAWLRKAAGLTQEELGERIGWTYSQVSEAERSWNGKRTREFDAQELAAIALGLGVPLSALFLPPEAAGNFSFRDGAGKEHGMRDLLQAAVPDNDDETPVMGAYRQRWNAAAERHFGGDPYWMRLVARWIGDTARRRGEIAGRLRGRRDDLLGAAAEYGELADEIEGGGQ